MLAELGHGDAAQGQRRRVGAQGDPLEGAERVAGGEGARGGGDQGVHDDRLLRHADFAPRLLLPGRGRARLEIGSEVNMQPRLRPRRATPDHPDLLSPELRIIHRVIARFLIQQAGLKGSQACSGAVTLIQRFASAANLNIHLHCLVLDGVYRITEGIAVFHEAPSPTAAPLQALLSRIITRIMKRLTRAGYLVEEEGMSYPGKIDADRSHGIRWLPVGLRALGLRFRRFLASVDIRQT